MSVFPGGFLNDCIEAFEAEESTLKTNTSVFLVIRSFHCIVPSISGQSAISKKYAFTQCFLALFIPPN